MIFAVIGGDRRSLFLISLLRADGHTVRHFALEKALPGGARSIECAAQGADCVILPLPAARGGLLNAPYTAAAPRMAEVLHALRGGTPVCAGMADESLKAACEALSLPLHDYFLREDFTLRNAELTAEAAVALMAQRRPLRGSRVLISGFGRIGTRLAALLLREGAAVTAAARSARSRTAAEALGCRAIDIGTAAAPGYDFAVNTVPFPIFGADALQKFGGAACIELASPPYGFDLAAARDAGADFTLASGLPGKYAPGAAAAAVRDGIYAILEE